MSDQISATAERFVGRLHEIDQFKRAIKYRSSFFRFIFGPNTRVKPQVFLPYGIGGIGKTRLSRVCLQYAEMQGWATIEIDWDRADTRPSNEMQMLNLIAERLRKIYGDKSIDKFLKKEKQIQYVKESVHHLKLENQQKWLEMVNDLHEIGGKKNGIDIGAIVTDVGKLINVGADKLARAEDHFSEWLVSTGKIKADEGSLYRKGEVFLASRLVEVISDATSFRPLALLFDTCEALSPELEEWLRDVVVCPLVETGKPVICIVSGQNNQYYERQVEIRAGKFKVVKGYADRLGDPSPLLWNLTRFADTEIADYISDFGFEPKQELIDFIQELARGIPYAVQLITQAFLVKGIEYVKNNFPPKDSRTFSTQEMVTLVTQRFLRYCLTNETDLSQVYALAMMDEWSEKGLQIVWGLPESKSAEKVLQTLQTRYSFILPEMKVDEVVREFIRKELRSKPRADTQEMGRRLSSYYLSVWVDFEKRFTNLHERLAEPHYRELSFNTLNGLLWWDETAATKYLLERLIECGIFKNYNILSLLSLFREFNRDSTWISSRSNKVVDLILRLIFTDVEIHDLNDIDNLLNEIKFLDFSNFYLGLLHILWGRKKYFSKEYSSAFTMLISAEELLSANDDSSIREGLAEEYNNVGWGLSNKDGWVVASQDALFALEHAVKINPNNGYYFVGLGVMKLNLDMPEEAIKSIVYGKELVGENSWVYKCLGSAFLDLDQTENAIQAFNKSIELDPRSCSSWDGLANVYRDLSYFDDAERCFKKALEIDPTDAVANGGIPDLLWRQGKIDQAIEMVNKSLDLKPSDDDGWRILGYIYRQSNRKEESKKAFLKALEIKNDQANWNGLGNIYADLGELDNAVRAYKNALELVPDEPYYSDNLANMYLEQGNYLSAHDLYKKMITLNPKSIAHVSLAMCLSKLGDEEKSREEEKIAQSLIEVYPLYIRARVKALQKDVEESLKYIRASLASGDVSSAWINRDPLFEYIRLDPNFHELVRDNINKYKFVDSVQSTH